MDLWDAANRVCQDAAALKGRKGGAPEGWAPTPRPHAAPCSRWTRDDARVARPEEGRRDLRAIRVPYVDRRSSARLVDHVPHGSSSSQRSRTCSPRRQRTLREAEARSPRVIAPCHRAPMSRCCGDACSSAPAGIADSAPLLLRPGAVGDPTQPHACLPVLGISMPVLGLRRGPDKAHTCPTCRSAAPTRQQVMTKGWSSPRPRRPQRSSVPVM